MAKKKNKQHAPAIVDEAAGVSEHPEQQEETGGPSEESVLEDEQQNTKTLIAPLAVMRKVKGFQLNLDPEHPPTEHDFDQWIRQATAAAELTEAKHWHDPQKLGVFRDDLLSNSTGGMKEALRGLTLKPNAEDKVLMVLRTIVRPVQLESEEILVDFIYRLSTADSFQKLNVILETGATNIDGIGARTSTGN